MTPPLTVQETAARAAEAIRVLNHQTRPGTALTGEIDVVDVYDIVAELALLASRLPQLLGQLERLVDDLVEDHQVTMTGDDATGDPVVAAAVVGHWLTVARTAAGQTAHGLDQAQQTLATAAAVTPT